jgi:hypothetical protein
VPTEHAGSDMIAMLSTLLRKIPTVLLPPGALILLELTLKVT